MKFRSIHRCSICSKELDTLIALRAHLRVHESGRVTKKYPCNECSKSFYGKHHLSRHLKDAHDLGNNHFIYLGVPARE